VTLLQSPPISASSARARRLIAIQIAGAPSSTAYSPLSTTFPGALAASQFVTGCSRLFASWADEWSGHVNTLPRFDPERALIAGGDPNIAYYHSYWRLAPDEALVIDATPPACDYWNFQLANYWLESLDYRYFDVHVNPHTAKAGADGSIQVVVAHENPGVDNWLDTCGHSEGTMCWRWIGAKEHPQPQTRVVKLAELRGNG
jgi:hypothetical protein